MAINIDDTTRRRAIKILEDEQTQLDGAYDKQAIKGPGEWSLILYQRLQNLLREEKKELLRIRTEHILNEK